MWEAILQGEEQGIVKEDIRFAPARLANPYREVFFKDINRILLDGEPVEVNAYYRYGAIFSALLDEDMNKYTELRKVLFDILTHYLSELDLRQGLCRAEYYFKFLREDIEANLFGPKCGERLKCFTGKQRRLVLAGLLRMYKAGVSMLLLAQLLRELYPGSITYMDARGVRELLIYIGQKKTPALTAQVELICDLFVPADYDIKLFWDKHFGLIDTDETMDIGNIMMF